MDAIKHALTYQVWGAPVWALVVIGSILLFENYLASNPKIAANSTIQLIRGWLGFVRFVPIVGPLLVRVESRTVTVTAVAVPPPLQEVTPIEKLPRGVE